MTDSQVFSFLSPNNLFSTHCAFKITVWTPPHRSKPSSGFPPDEGPSPGPMRSQMECPPSHSLTHHQLPLLPSRSLCSGHTQGSAFCFNTSLYPWDFEFPKKVFSFILLIPTSVHRSYPQLSLPPGGERRERKRVGKHLPWRARW